MIISLSQNIPDFLPVYFIRTAVGSTLKIPEKFRIRYSDNKGMGRKLTMATEVRFIGQ